MTIAEGFPGERLRVMAAPLVEEAGQRPGTRHLLVTDSGFFPHASRHGRSRVEAVNQVVVIACVAGTGWCNIDGEQHSVSDGEVLVIPPGVVHSYGADTDNPWTIWWFHAAGVDVGELLTLAGIDRTRPVVRLAQIHQLTALIDGIVSSMERDDSPLTLLAASGLAWHALTLIAAQQTVARHRVDPVALATEYLWERVGERISVAQLASLVGLSPSHFAALFRTRTGFAVLEYQTRQRMARARELLDTTDETVSRIAHEVGYADAFYFTRQFRKVHDCSPSEYRNAAKG